MKPQTTENRNIGCRIPFINFVPATITTIIGQNIHGTWWGILDFILWPVVWVKWLICKDVTWSIIKESFSWFMQ